MQQNNYILKKEKKRKEIMHVCVDEALVNGKVEYFVEKYEKFVLNLSKQTSTNLIPALQAYHCVHVNYHFWNRHCI